MNQEPYILKEGMEDLFRKGSLTYFQIKRLQDQRDYWVGDDKEQSPQDQSHQ